MNIHPAYGFTLILAIMFAVLGLPTSSSSVDTLAAEDTTPGAERLSRGWQIYRGEVARDSLGRPLWRNLEDKNWVPIDPLTRLEQTGDPVWYRNRLPQRSWSKPVLLLHGISREVQVFINQSLVYDSQKESITRGKRSEKEWHFLHLDHRLEGQTLYLCVHSQDPYHIGMRYPAHVGTLAGLYRYLFERSILRMAIGFLYLLLGVLSVVLFALRYEKRPYFILSFSAFVILIGIFEVFNPAFTQIMLQVPEIWYTLDPAALFLFPVGMYLFFSGMLPSLNQILFRMAAALHLLFATVAFAGDVILDYPAYALINVFYMLIAATGIITCATIAYASLKGKIPGYRFLWGIGALAITGLHDILNQLHLLSDSLLLFKWGLLVLVLNLFYELERHFAEANRSLEQYHHELQESHQKLEEYSRSLEDKVRERTHELQKKNNDLKAALSELKDTQNQLIMQEKMASLGNLVAGIAHEVNNPIGAVNSAADVAERCLRQLRRHSESDAPVSKKLTPEKTLHILDENMHIITLAGKRISNIVKSLKNFARLDEADLQKVDLHDGIESTLTLLQHELKNRIEIVRDYGDLPHVECFPNQLNQVFMNILLNGIQAIQGKGTLSIKTGQQDNSIKIEFTDTGKGIAEDKLPHIFDPGFTTKGVGVGTGLGLSISYNIIQKHHGHIWVASKPGTGTTFTISLPIHQT
jgi:signal transduction histidine kinase